MILYHQIKAWLAARLQNQVHRQLLVISGPQDWAIKQATFVAKQDYVWVGASQGYCNCVTNQQYQNYLGQEFSVVVLNCYSGFRANAAIALSGTIKAGGLMVIICPDLESWPRFKDPEWLNRVSYGYEESMNHSHFIDKFISAVHDDTNVAILTKHKFSGTITKIEEQELNADLMPLKAINEQQVAINSIIKVATGHRNRPLVLSADRGRGKSSALGIAAAHLMQSATKKIVIVAPSPNTVQHVFKHAEQHLPEALSSKNKLSLGAAYLHYVAPDAILTTDLDIDLLLIDEAAALPAHLLYKLIDKYSRIVFSTTLHGYEGSGRGFDLRVKQYLNQAKPDWRSMHLTQAMRWYNSDYLESFWFDLFCIKGNTSTTNQELQGTATCSYISKAQLADDAQLSYSIFQLLIDAHYQTSPDDFIRLFDSPEQHCYVLKKQNSIIGVALIIEEGGERLAPLQQNITAGSRRVKGHLVAQNIAFHYAQAEFCVQKQWRITRLAISANYQGQGLGSTLLSYVAEQAKAQKNAFLTTSFGLNQPLLRFWQKAGFQVVNLSKKPEVSSAEHSAQLLMPLNEGAANTEQIIVAEFVQEALYQSDKAFKDIDPVVLHLILSQVPPTQTSSASNQLIVEQFVQGSRPLNLCKRQLRHYYLDNISQFKHIDSDLISLVTRVLLQNQNEISVAKTLGLASSKAMEQVLRQTIGCTF